MAFLSKLQLQIPHALSLGVSLGNADAAGGAKEYHSARFRSWEGYGLSGGKCWASC